MSQTPTALFLACGLLFTAVGAAQPAPALTPTTDPHAHHHPAPGERGALAQAARAELQRNLAAMDERIDRLAEELTAASGEAKERARAALLSELLAQRRRLREMVVEGVKVPAPPLAEQAAAKVDGCGCCMGHGEDHGGADHGGAPRCGAAHGGDGAKDCCAAPAPGAASGEHCGGTGAPPAPPASDG